MKRIVRWSAVAALSVLLSGCYTVLMAPRLSRAGDVQPSLSATPDPRLYDQSEVGTYGADQEAWEDYYRYPGAPGGYGYGGYPSYGYGYGGASGYYGYAPYFGYGYYGYGPYSYGYDPYYYGRGGYTRSSNYYVPVGYQMVTQGELEQLRASRRALADLEKDTRTPEQIEHDRQVQEQQRAEVWNRRVQSRLREAPAVPAAAQTQSTGSSSGGTPTYTSSSSSSGSTSSSGGSSSSPKSGSSTTTVEPRKTRR